MGRRPCCSKEGLNRGAWTAMEDKTLRDYIKVHGEGKWRDLPKSAGLKRCGKSCRLRWLNYLRPDIKRGNITRDEEDLIIRLHKLLGNRWSLIAGRLPGRTDNEIKNYWNTNIGKKVLQGHPVSSISTTSHRKSSNQTTKENPSPTTRRSRSIGLPLLPNLVSSSSSSCVVRTKASRCTKVFISSLQPQNTYQFNSESKPSGGGGQEPSTVGHQAFHCDAKVVGPGAGAGPGPNQDPEPLDAYISVSQFISTGDNNPSDYMVDFEMDTKFLSDFLNTNLIEPLCDVDNGLQLRVEPKGDNTSSSYPNSDQTFFLFSNELLLDSDLQSMAAAVAPLPCTGMDWLQDQ